MAQLGLLLQAHRIIGANARCVAVLTALQDLIRGSTEIKAMFGVTRQNADRINAIVRENCTFLSHCRRFTPGMQWVAKCFYDRLTMAGESNAAAKLPEQVAMLQLRSILEDVTMAISQVVVEGARCIAEEGDVILTYGRSSTIEQALLLAAQTVRFTVVVVDSGPLYEGRGLQWRLQQRGLKTSYVLLSAVCATMPRISKVVIGAAAVLQNGQVVGRAGTAAVSLVAKRFRVPILCFCETYKFTERVFSARERPEGLLASYDVTPKDVVDMIVSDIGLLHPSALAAAIRDRNDREARVDVSV